MLAGGRRRFSFPEGTALSRFGSTLCKWDLNLWQVGILIERIQRNPLLPPQHDRSCSVRSHQSSPLQTTNLVFQATTERGDELDETKDAAVASRLPADQHQSEIRNWIIKPLWKQPLTSTRAALYATAEFLARISKRCSLAPSCSVWCTKVPFFVFLSAAQSDGLSRCQSNNKRKR